MIKVMFVCLGNICRSPMAEAVFQQMVYDAGLEEQIFVASSGTTGWHNGEPAHTGTRKVLAKHGINYRGRSQRIDYGDYSDPDSYIIAMDEHNVADLRRRFGDSPRLSKLLDYAQNTHETDVPDPYYGGGFDYVYQLVVDSCTGLLTMLRREHNL